MKVYSIGRDVNCNIVINDNTDVISRRHAILNVSSSGKMTIVDQSQNGTYVNGIRIQPNVPVPVTRKDNVSFAHVARLDWSLVPNTYGYLRYAAFGLLGLLVVVGAIFGFKAMLGGDNEGQQSTAAATDTVKKVVITEAELLRQQDSLRKVLVSQVTDSMEKKRLNDSIDRDTKQKLEKRRADSIAQAKRDSIAKWNKTHRCQYCGKLLNKCPYKGKKHDTEKKPATKDSTSTRRF